MCDFYNKPVSRLIGQKNFTLQCFDTLCASIPFASIPLASALDSFVNMRRSVHKPGEKIIRQYAKGDNFYFILSGTAEAHHETEEENEQIIVSTLKTGDAFGEEALILGDGQHSTVIIKERTVLGVLDGQIYQKHVGNSLISTISVDAASNLYGLDNTVFLDIRYNDEFTMGSIKNCAHIPMHELRHRFNELDVSKKVIVFCRSGHRSKLGALLLRKQGFDAYSMDGGIIEWNIKMLNNAPFLATA